MLGYLSSFPHNIIVVEERFLFWATSLIRAELVDQRIAKAVIEKFTGLSASDPTMFGCAPWHALEQFSETRPVAILTRRQVTRINGPGHSAQHATQCDEHRIVAARLESANILPRQE